LSVLGIATSWLSGQLPAPDPPGGHSCQALMLYGKCCTVAAGFADRAVLPTHQNE
jgi:hypothetical protein